MTISIRQANALGFAACAAMFGYALYEQHYAGLAPCHLCIFQRVGVLVLGLVFLVAALHAPRRGGARVYGVLTALAAAGIELGTHYPAPVVLHDEARQRTLDRFAAVKKKA